MADRSPLLSVKDLRKSFVGVPALVGADLDISKGEVHALVGQNGAGKSTLIKVLTGYYARDSGAIEFDGSPLNLTSPHQAQLRGISTIYQEINLVGYRSVTENICVGRSFRRWGMLDWPAMDRTARELLARFNMKIDVSQPLESFSVAIQQMVAIARAVGFSAKLVIMDEPTSSLEDREVETLFDVIRQLRNEGVSIIFVSHKLDELYAVCDRITILRDGHTVRSASIADISKVEVVATMLGKDVGTVRRKGVTAFERHQADAHDKLIETRSLGLPPRVLDVNIAVGRGEIVGLAGLLGSGRTETARLLFGAETAKHGTMTYDGTEYRPMEPRDAIRRGIGFCTEDRKLEGIVPDLSVRENLSLALLPSLVRKSVVDTTEEKRIIEDFVRKLGIKCSSIEQPVRQLSGGNQQKVLLARWLCMNPKFLILDEPTRGIDVGAKAEIQILIADLAEKGLAVLMVSSEIEEIAEGADHAYVLRDGRTVVQLSGEALTEENLLQAMAHGANPDDQATHP